jgi:hypothetical protein
MVPRTRPESGYEFYECNGRKITGCAVGAVRRSDIDDAVLNHFEQTGLDLEATREAVVAAMDRRASDARALLEGAEHQAQQAKARLARVKRDYTNGDLTATEWRELRAELEPESDAAQAEAERLQEQFEIVENRSALDDAETELIGYLTQIRAAIGGEVASAEDAGAVRAVLRRLFDRFVFHPELPPGQTNMHVELLHSDFWIEPIASERAIADYEEKVRPVFREPYEQTDNNQRDDAASRYLSADQTQDNQRDGLPSR